MTKLFIIGGITSATTNIEFEKSEHFLVILELRFGLKYISGAPALPQIIPQH